MRQWLPLLAIRGKNGEGHRSLHRKPGHQVFQNAFLDIWFSRILEPLENEAGIWPKGGNLEASVSAWGCEDKYFLYFLILFPCSFLHKLVFLVLNPYLFVPIIERSLFSCKLGGLLSSISHPHWQLTKNLAHSHLIA